MSDEVKLTWGKTENDLLQRWPKSADGTPEEPALLTVAMDTNAETDMLCAMLRPQRPSVESILASCRRVTVLENVMNPTNVGAIFRSAAALGMDAVLLTSGCTDPLYRRSARVSMGTVFQVPWAYLEGDWQAMLHGCGFRTAAMALTDDSVSIDHPALAAEPRLAIVLGTEGDGLARTTIAACDYTVKIPMSHGVDSLNVAAASAVAFDQLGRRA